MLTPRELIENKIITIRGIKVMLDKDLALLYDVETKYLKRQVRRNLDRFPSDFMFKLTKHEFSTVRGHFGTSRNTNTGGSRIVPLAFTEHGILMLSSVLKSKKATEINIAIMRIFLYMRNANSKYDKLKSLVVEHQEEIQKIWFELEKVHIDDDPESQRQIGFKVN